jgi:hypothetical protein
MMTRQQPLENQVAGELAASLRDNPGAWAWRDGDRDIVRGPGGISMSANYFTIYSPMKVYFGFWNRRRIRRAFKHWKATTGNALAMTEHERALLALRRCLAEPLRAVA